MKKTAALLIFTLFAAAALAQVQKDVTQFLGIPVDGSKPKMIQKLKLKGFTSSLRNKDILVGEFNGMDVEIDVVTNNNKVCRIVVSDAYPQNEGNIKIRFNTLCQQFQSNKNYVSASLSKSGYTIPEDEDISYELSVHNKRYEAVFYQKPAGVNSVAFNNSKKIVWFMISERYGRYYIMMFYDNEYNRANGEDL